MFMRTATNLMTLALVIALCATGSESIATFFTILGVAAIPALASLGCAWVAHRKDEALT